MDYQAVIIAVIGSASLTKTIDVIAATGPKTRSLRKQVARLEARLDEHDLAWREWWARLRRWLLARDIDTGDMPTPPTRDPDN